MVEKDRRVETEVTRPRLLVKRRRQLRELIMYSLLPFHSFPLLPSPSPSPDYSAALYLIAKRYRTKRIPSFQSPSPSLTLPLPLPLLPPNKILTPNPLVPPRSLPTPPLSLPPPQQSGVEPLSLHQLRALNRNPLRDQERRLEQGGRVVVDRRRMV